jgi:superfamily II DNA or RNA helicase
MKQCTLRVLDEVNIKFDDLDPALRRDIGNALKFFLPYARHTPSYKLGRWDGCIKFFDTGGRSYFNLLETILPIIDRHNYKIEVIDERIPFESEFETITEESFADTLWPKKHPLAGQPIMLRDHQVEAINAFLENLQCIQEIATGAGKTMITAALSKKVEPYGRSIVVVPNKSLVTQTEADYINLGLDVGVFFGDRKEYNKTHTICTWQSLNILMKKSKKVVDLDFTMADFIEDVVCVIIDEAHQSKADALKELLTGPFRHIPIRWGLTGTIPKEDVDRITLKIGLGEVVNQISAKSLQEKGLLAQCDVNILQLQDQVEFANYPKELKYLTTDTKRMSVISHMINNISEGGNTLILVDRIASGELLKESLEGSIFIHGTMKGVTRQDHYDDVATATNKIIIATYGVAAVGINIPRIFNLVLIEPGKSFVRVIQSIGRGIRVAEDKDHVQIWDITSSCKYAKRHLTTRKKFYNEAQYPHTVTKLNL